MRISRSGSITRWRNALALLVTLLGAAGCNEANLIGPENQLEVGNNPDTFQWQVTALDNVTQTLTYSWQTTGTVINVNQSHSSIGGGSATLRIVDANGTQVYEKSLTTESGSFQTTAGVAGPWTVTVTLNEVSGALNFRLQKP